MKRILEKFLDQFIALLAQAIDRKINETKITVHGEMKIRTRETIDELVSIVQGAIMCKVSKTEITYSLCEGYAMTIYGSDGNVIHSVNGMRDFRMLFQCMLDEITDKTLIQNESATT